jgi:purine-binding chemotaxis protein CheW
MPTNKSDLQTLWEELNQSEEERSRQALEETLSQRARQYAAPLRETKTYAEDEVYHVLSFRLGSETYGVDVDVIRGIRPLEHLTRVPSAPDFYRGVVNVRGQIISVLDLRAFFGMESSEKFPKAELVLVGAGDMTLALLAERVDDVETIPRNMVESVEMRYARGISHSRLIILDMISLLNDERLIVGGKSSS